jgi:hypothetical protein
MPSIITKAMSSVLCKYIGLIKAELRHLDASRQTLPNFAYKFNEFALSGLHPCADSQQLIHHLWPEKQEAGVDEMIEVIA